MKPYGIIWVQLQDLYGLKWYSKNYGIKKIFNFFVGRERKGQAAFSPLVLLSGSEDVVKQETEGRPEADGRRSPARSGLETEVFQLPQEQGRTIR